MTNTTETQPFHLHPQTAAAVGESAERLSPGQAAIYALTVVSFRELRKDYKPLIVVRSVLCMATALLVSQFAMLAIYLLLKVVAFAIGDIAMAAMYPLAIVVLLIALFLALALKFSDVTGVEAVQIDGRIRHLTFQRMSWFVAPRAVIAASLLFGLTVGVQAGLLYFTESHGGLPIKGGWVQCWLLTLDNVFRGLLLDTFEVYDISLTTAPDHGFWSATLFYAFRLSYDGFAVTLFLISWNRRNVTGIVREFGECEAADPDKFVTFLRTICYEKKRWVKLCFHEFVFLCLVEKYLSGKYADCKMWIQTFPDFSMPEELRTVFLDDSGASMFDTE